MLYTLYSASDGSVSIDIRDNDVIEAISMEAWTLTPVDGAVGKAELSLGTASQFTTNDASNVIASISVASDSAMGQHSMQRADITGIQVPINGGERIYLHNLKGSQTDLYVRVIVYTRKSVTKIARR